MFKIERAEIKNGLKTFNIESFYKYNKFIKKQGDLQFTNLPSYVIIVKMVCWRFCRKKACISIDSITVKQVQ